MSDYKEQIKKKDREKTKKLLQDLPVFCTEFYNERAVRLLPKTQLNYASKISIFFGYLHENYYPFTSKPITAIQMDDIKCIQTSHIASFLDFVASGESNPNCQIMIDLSGRPCVKTNKRSTLDNYLSCLSSYFSYWMKKGYIDKNPVQAIEYSRTGAAHQIIYLHDDDKKSVLQVSQTGKGLTARQSKAWDKTALREMAIVLLLLDTGIRVSELVGLDLSDLDLTHCCIKVQRKGDRPDTVYFSDTTATTLTDYLEYRSSIPESQNQPALFVTSIGTHVGQRLGVRSVEKMIKKYAKAAGVMDADKITPHKLRSTYAMNMLEATGNLSTVQQQLGHKSINSTVLYAKSTDKEKEKHRNDLY